jgi:hypothetical protein
VQATQATRILLSLLVWVNLTLMCQGHSIHRQYIGPHLTLMDLFHGHQMVSDDPVAPAVDAYMTHEQAEHMMPPEGVPAARDVSTPGANMLGATYSAPAEAFSGAMLGLAFLVAWALRAGRLRPMVLAAVPFLITQFVMRPEPPPPRRDLSTLVYG